MDTLEPQNPVVAAEKTEKKIVAKFKKISSNFRNLPIGTKRLLSLGMVVALLVALPVVVLTVISNRTYFFNRAATGETIEPPYTSTPSPTLVPTSTPIQTVPPSCGTRCDISCPSGLTCYQPPMPPCASGTSCIQVMPAKICRNAKCPTSTNCLCNTTVPTTTPILKTLVPTPRTPSPTPKSTTPLSPTPTSISNTPIPVVSPIPSALPTIETTSLSAGRINRYYSATITGYEPAVTALKMSITTLPSGLAKTCTISSSDGSAGTVEPLTTIKCTVKGVPYAWGRFPLTIKLSDGFGQSVTKIINLWILPF